MLFMVLVRKAMYLLFLFKSYKSYDHMHQLLDHTWNKSNDAMSYGFIVPPFSY